MLLDEVIPSKARERERERKRERERERESNLRVDPHYITDSVWAITLPRTGV